MNTKNASAKIPSFAGGWLLGNLTEFRKDNLAFYERCRRELGPVAAFRLGYRRLVMVNDPSLIEEVLVAKNRSFQKHYATRLLRPVLGNGLLLSEGSKWLKQRRLIQPAFSRRFTEQFAAIVQSHTLQMAKRWRAEPRRDLYRDMTQLTVQIAASAFLGVNDTDETRAIGDCLHAIHADFEFRFQNPWHFPYWVPSPQNLCLRNAVGQLTEIIERMIASRRGDAEKHFDALSLLLRAEDESGRKMSSQLLRDEVMTLLLAGHDTTANSLTWTWTLLARHPQVAVELQGEIAQKEPAALVESTSLVQRVVKESMRLFPPVYIFGREAIEPVPLGGYEIRKGDSVVMSQWVVHRDEQYFPNPNQFLPDRWTPEFESRLPRYAYFPFGGGPRVCIGKEVAMVEAATILSILAAQFDVQLESADGITPWPTVTLRPRDAVWARVTPVASSAEQANRSMDSSRYESSRS